MVVSFPHTSDADKVLAAFDRFIEDGEPVTIPGAYIGSFEQHEELARIFGSETPAELSLGPALSSRLLQVAVEVDTLPVPLSYEGLSLRCVRSGRRRSSFETGTGRPLHVKLQTERLENGHFSLGLSLALQLAGHPLSEAEHAVAIWTAIQGGAEYRLRVVQGDHVLARGTVSSPDTSQFWLYSYVADLAAIQRRLGWDLRIPEMVSRRDRLDAAELRSILETGVYRSPCSCHTLTYTSDLGAPNPLLEIGGTGAPFWCRTSTEMAAYEILGRTLNLGVAHTFALMRLADGEAERARALLQAGATEIKLRIEAAGDGITTNVYRDFLPTSTRLRYDQLVDHMPPILDWSPEAIATLSGALAQKEATQRLGFRQGGGPQVKGGPSKSSRR